MYTLGLRAPCRCTESPQPASQVRERARVYARAATLSAAPADGGPPSCACHRLEADVLPDL